MNTKIIKIDPAHIDLSEMQAAGKIIKEGGLVAFPTETVYGLGGDALNAQASKKIYAAKGRPSDNPLIVHISSVERMEEIVRNVSPTAYFLAKTYWPGPMTLILNKNEKVPYETTGGMDTVAIRLPSDPIARALIDASTGFIAAPSANTSGRPSPTSAQHVIEDLNGRIDEIIDGGQVGIGLESTIIDLTEEIPTILRPGYITLEMLQETLGEVRMDPGLIASDSAKKPKAPGMKYRHYAPQASLTLVEGECDRVVDEINRLCRLADQDGKKVGILATDETKDRYPIGEVLCIGSRNDEASIGRHLFGVLREFDRLQVDVIYSESFSDAKFGHAIMNRLLKAAGHHVLEV